MISKEQVLESMKSLPEEFDREDLIERLLIIDTFNKGKEETTDEKLKGLALVRKEFDEWRKSG